MFERQSFGAHCQCAATRTDKGGHTIGEDTRTGRKGCRAYFASLLADATDSSGIAPEPSEKSMSQIDACRCKECQLLIAI